MEQGPAQEKREMSEAREKTLATVIDTIFSSLNLKHIDRATVTEETQLGRGGLDLDSIDTLELIVHFEQTFGIKVNESESYAQHFKTVGSIVDFVQSQAKCQKA